MKRGSVENHNEHAPTSPNKLRRAASGAPVKYVVVTGGTASGLGKGITASSIGVLLKGCGLKVSCIKIDPYINLDAGTMSPFEHGEVFVLEDGGEADLDLGNYERFLRIRLGKDNNITTGKIYQSVIEKERRGDYLGKTVQVVPHITDEIINWIQRASTNVIDEDDAQDMAPGEADVCVIELGGTVGDIESMPFVEALRQLQFRVGGENLCLVEVTLVPQIAAGGEQKTKPTQHAVKELRSAGLMPDIICCRCAAPLEDGARRKLSLFCQVPTSHVISIHDVKDVYRVPLLLQEQNICSIIAHKLKMYIPKGLPKIPEWRALVARQDAATIPLSIAIVGKYTAQSDTYLSVVHALRHAAIAADRVLTIVWVEADDLVEGHANNARAWELVKGVDGVLVPGGFGERGYEGMVQCIRHARENKIPFLGICLGMQVAVIEFARHKLGMKDATSEEFDPNTASKAIVYMPEVSKTHMGGTMRLGVKETLICDGESLARTIYQSSSAFERHRHRYEVNPDLVDQLEAQGLRFSGRDSENRRMEFVEIDPAAHPFFFGTQCHPEFLSRVLKPSPPFLAFVRAASKQSIVQ